jgi:CO/xanthine dehydrogenase Mo-binding subunit
VIFDSSRVTSTDWTHDRIPKTQDVPEIKTVFTSRSDRGINNGGEASIVAIATVVAIGVRRTVATSPHVLPASLIRNPSR